VVHYLSPNWSGFTFILAYSSNPAGIEGDIASGIRKGGAWNFNPNFAGKNWQVGYSYWDSKPDGATGLANQFVPALATAVGGTATAATAGAAATNQRGDRLYGSYVFPFGLKVGLAWDKSRFKSSASGATTARRDAWSLPVSYAWGNHTIHVNYSQANQDKAAAFNPAAGRIDTKATLWALSYSYDLSKRTSVALSYAAINNHSGAAYNLFTSASLGQGASAGALVAGEDPKMWGVTLRHAY
jgi:predicted porin